MNERRASVGEPTLYHNRDLRDQSPSLSLAGLAPSILHLSDARPPAPPPAHLFSTFTYSILRLHSYFLAFSLFPGEWGARFLRFFLSRFDEKLQNRPVCQCWHNYLTMHLFNLLFFHVFNRFINSSIQIVPLFIHCIFLHNIISSNEFCLQR